MATYTLSGVSYLVPHSTPDIGGLPGFVPANAGAVALFQTGTPFLTSTNPGFFEPLIGGAAGFSAGNPGYVVPYFGGAVGFSLANPGLVAPVIGGAAGFTNANPGFVKQAGAGTGTDFSETTWGFSGAPGTVNNQLLLSTITVTVPGAFYVQNQSTGPLICAFWNGATGTPTFIVLDPAVASGRQGGSTDAMPWFTGQILVFGATGSQFGAMGK
jgi:hypothetical protein